MVPNQPFHCHCRFSDTSETPSRVPAYHKNITIPSGSSSITPFTRRGSNEPPKINDSAGRRGTEPRRLCREHVRVSFRVRALERMSIVEACANDSRPRKSSEECTHSLYSFARINEVHNGFHCVGQTRRRQSFADSGSEVAVERVVESVAATRGTRKAAIYRCSVCRVAVSFYFPLGRDTRPPIGQMRNKHMGICFKYRKLRVNRPLS